ncbi:MAG TPA: alpha-amylase, partial [Verrucomicrobiae bacterium]
SDTLQLDYRLADVHRAMTELLLEIARSCDGVRCDMAMLVLNEVFRRTWAGFPGTRPVPEREFWDQAIGKVKEAYPGFLFLAEAYWGLEPRLQALGFDYTYDKELYDKLMAGDAQGVQRHLLGLSSETLGRGAHFLENHDEPRVATRLSAAQHCAAALLILGLPGMRFLHEGQLSGARLRLPVQLGRRSVELEQPEIRRMYEQFLTALKATSVGRGSARVLTNEPATGDCVFIQWEARATDFDVVAVNLTNRRHHCRVELTLPQPNEGEWEMSDLAATDKQPPHSLPLVNGVLELDLPEFGAQLLHFQRGEA